MCEAELFPQGVPIGCSPVGRPKVSDLLVPVFRLKDRYFIAVKGRIENGGVRACPQECFIRITTLRVKFCRAFWLVLRVILQKVVLQDDCLRSN